MKKILILLLMIFTFVLLNNALAQASTKENNKHLWIAIRVLEKELAPLWPALKEMNIPVRDTKIDFKKIKPTDYLARLVMWKQFKDNLQDNPEVAIQFSQYFANDSYYQTSSQPMLSGRDERKFTLISNNPEVMPQNAKLVRNSYTETTKNNQISKVVPATGQTTLYTNLKYSAYESEPDKTIPQESWLKEQEEIKKLDIII